MYSKVKESDLTLLVIPKSSIMSNVTLHNNNGFVSYFVLHLLKCCIFAITLTTYCGAIHCITARCLLLWVFFKLRFSSS